MSKQEVLAQLGVAEAIAEQEAGAQPGVAEVQPGVAEAVSEQEA